jgi:hypothetical protein
MAPAKCEAALAQARPAWPIARVSLSDRTLRLALLIALAALGGCGGVQAGGQTGEESDGRCVFATSPLSQQELSPLGFSADQALALVADPHHATFSWQQASGLTYGPETGTGEVTVEIAASGGARFARVDAARSTADCEDHVRIPVSVALVTAGGALDEVFSANLVAATADEAAITQSVPSASLRGALAFTESTLGDRRFIRLEVNLRFGRSSFAGYLLGGIESGDDSGSKSFQPVPLACWGVIPSLASCAE